MNYMKKRSSLITFILIACFFVNVFIPKAIFSADITNALSQAIECQSALLYYASISTLTFGILNKYMAKELGLTAPKNTSPQPAQNENKTKKDTSSNDYSLVTGQSNLLTKTTLTRFINPVYTISDISIISCEYNFFQGIGFWLFIHAILMLCFFFLLPRSAIDGHLVLNILRT
jgi:hypothetical protein